MFSALMLFISPLSNLFIRWFELYVAGHIMDGSNGDIAVDHYHRYPVTQVTLFFFFLLVIICMRFVHNLSSIQAQDQCELNMNFLQVIKNT